MKKIISLFIILFSIGFLTACNMDNNTKKYTITYNLDGGVLPSDAVTSFTDGAKVELPIPTKIDGEFLGWYDENDVLVESLNGIEENITLTAKWEIVYTITYNLNGGDLPSDAVTSFTPGSEVILPTPSKESHNFIGWFNEDNKEVTDLNGATSSIVLYAKWEEFIKGVTYSIKYVLNEGFFDKKVEYSYVSGEEFILPIPVKPAHEFISWCDYDSNEPIDRISCTTQGDVKVYAWFEKATIVREIKYNLDGGTFSDDVEYSYTEGIPQELPTPTKEGYWFRGWYTSSTFEKPITAITKMTYGDKDLYAKWAEPSIENANFGILGDSISSFYSKDSDYNSIFTTPGQYYFPNSTHSIKKVEQTWWYQTINAIGGNIFVNNSYSGGTVHANGISSGNNEERIAKFNAKGQIPDVIIIYLGINDTGGKFTKEFFKGEYQGMIDKILQAFPDVQIFVCTLPDETRTDGIYRAIYNEAIVELANEYNLPLIDFRTAWNPETHTVSDYFDDGLHPNVKGMKILADIATLKIKEFYNID